MTSESKFGMRYIFNGANATPMFHIEQVPLPQLNDGEILVKVRTATICLSDIHTVCGTRIEPTPSVLGHEACVEVVDHKREQDSSIISIGDRLTFSIADSCGQCEYCLNDLSQKCKSLFKYGHAHIASGSGFNGSYASHIILRKGTHVKKLPHEIDDFIGSTINCALATMVNCIESIPECIRLKGKKALVQGDGMLGLFACALLNNLGFKQIYCSGHRQNRSHLIEKFGATPIYHDEVLEEERSQIDVVIEVCGASSVIEDGLNYLKPGGAYMLVGMVHPNTKLNITGEQIIRKCLTIKGIHNYNDKHLDGAVDFLTNTISKYPYNEMISPNKFKLNDLPQAINEAKLKKYPRVAVEPF